MRFDPAIFGLSHIPEKSGLPSGVRGIAVDDFDGACAETIEAIIATANIVKRFIKPRRVSFFTGGGAPPPPRTYADASPRIYLSSARHGRGRFFPSCPYARSALPAYCCGFNPSIAVNTRRPSGNVTVSPDPLNDPSFARKP